MSILNRLYNSLIKEFDSLAFLKGMEKETVKNIQTSKREFPKAKPVLTEEELIRKKWLDNTRDVISRVESELASHPYIDKIKFYDDGNELKFRFENADIVTFIIGEGNSIELKFTIKTEYTHYRIKSNKLHSKLENLFEICSNLKSRISSEKVKSNNPLMDRYNVIVDKIRLRMEEINNITDISKKQTLTNELNNYKSIARNLKNKIMG